ncbi:MAG: DUF2442 domain-containing protein [Planctomycetota bacterium]
MKSAKPGSNISAEVTHVSTRGLWLLWNDRECFFDFERFPWFRDATISDIHTVEATPTGHFHWPRLDIDLHIDMLEEPERFPLVSRTG